MKKSITFLTFFVFGTLLINAQDVSVGIIGGMNFSNINGTYRSDGYYTNTTKLISKQFGIVLSYQLSKVLSLYSDPGYYEKGFKYHTDNDLVGSATVTGKSKFKSIDVPVTLKIGMFKNQIFYFRAGAYLSFLLSAKNNDTLYTPSPGYGSRITENDLSKKMNKTVFGFICGAGFDIPIQKHLKILVDVAYRIDLSNAMKNDQPPGWRNTNDNYYVYTDDVSSRSLSISVGLTYHFLSGK